jgi:hypothetical protein
MLHIGQVVSYILRPEDRPINPLREYQAIIVHIHQRSIKVELIEPGYEGLEEWIEEEQIRSVESKSESKEH